MPEDKEDLELEEEKKSEKSPAPTPRRKLVPVIVRAQKDGSTLVEFATGDDIGRCYVPADKIEDDKVDKTVLEAGIPYGIPWEDVLPDLPKQQAQLLGRELRKHGVWTEEDTNNVGAVKRAIGAVFGNIYGMLQMAAKEVENANE